METKDSVLKEAIEKYFDRKKTQSLTEIMNFSIGIGQKDLLNNLGMY
ncbi:hypothetical protein JXL19_05425 [bacterium]|nr:hypothetical protein [bacterium]